LHGAGPGNVGAILRTAAAAGVGAVLLGPGCADHWAPKSAACSDGRALRVADCRDRRSRALVRRTSRPGFRHGARREGRAALRARSESAGAVAFR
ncbi:TrmH family RNA methyltransferase, partial [Klebsiella pneumoniae]